MKHERNKPSVRNVSVILPDIRSAYNVGSIFRTSDAAGVRKIYLCGYTPAPKDRFGRENKQISKTALGAEKSVSWVLAGSAETLIKKLKRVGTEVIAVEQDRRAIDYRKLKLNKPVAFVFGNEVGGIAENILSSCDRIAVIPLSGRKESINVSVAAGVILFSVSGRLCAGRAH